MAQETEVAEKPETLKKTTAREKRAALYTDIQQMADKVSAERPELAALLMKTHTAFVNYERAKKANRAERKEAVVESALALNAELPRNNTALATSSGVP